MSIITRLRDRLFPIDDIEPLEDWTERDRIAAKADTAAIVQNQRANDMMRRWKEERDEDLRRLNISGNLLEGALRPDRRRDQA